MTQESQVSIRLSEELLARADKLAQRMTAHPDTKHLRPTRAAILRMAIERGLAALDEAYPPVPQ